MNKTRPKSLINTIASNNAMVMVMAENALCKLTNSHTPNLEMLLHLKISLFTIEYKVDSNLLLIMFSLFSKSF